MDNEGSLIRISHSKEAFLEYSNSVVLAKKIKYYNGFIEFILVFT